MIASKSPFRPLLIGALAVAVFASSGCAWMRSKWGNEARYQNSTQNQPLEVPPGLDMPSTAGGVAIPDVAPGAASAAPVATDVPAAGTVAPGGIAGIESFTLADSVESSWRRIGLALAKLEGVTVGDRAQLLNSYEVTYQGVTMLVRAEAAGDQTRVVALGADGRPMTSGAGAQLLALLKNRLG